MGFLLFYLCFVFFTKMKFSSVLLEETIFLLIASPVTLRTENSNYIIEMLKSDIIKNTTHYKFVLR